MANLIPHETIICDDKDSPWINNKIKKLIHKPKSLYKGQGLFQIQWYPNFWKINAFIGEVASGYGGIEEYLLLKVVYNFSKAKIQ